MHASPPVNAPRLQLATEALPAGRGHGSCVTVGPFVTRELASRARQTLTDSGYPSVPRDVATSVADGYWVYLESPTSEVAERRLLERLRRGGITDAQAVGDPGRASHFARRFLRRIARRHAVGAGRQARIAAADRRPREVGDHDLARSHPEERGAAARGQKFQAGDTELEFRPCPAVRQPRAPAAQ